MGSDTIKQKIDVNPAWAETVRAALFYAALVIEILVVLIDKSDLVNPYESYIFRLTFALTLIVVVLSKRTAGEWVLLALAVAVGFVSYRITGRNEILRVVVFVAACQGRSRERMLKVAFWETLAGCLVIFILSLTGLFGERSLTMLYRAQVGVETRYCFGFGHPNALHTMFMMLVVLGMLCYDGKTRLWMYLVLIVADFGLFTWTDSRIGVAMTAMILVLGVCVRLLDILFPRSNWRDHKWPYLTGELVLLACFVFSVWSAWVSTFLWDELPNMRIPRTLDLKMTQRISDLHYAKEHAGLNTWTLFSSSSAQRHFDMGWCRLFYWYGIIPGILVILALSWLIWWCWKHHEITVLIVTVGLCVYTVVEAHLISDYIGRNYLLFIFGAAIEMEVLQSGKHRIGLLTEKHVNL